MKGLAGVVEGTLDWGAAFGPIATSAPASSLREDGVRSPRDDAFGGTLAYQAGRPVSVQPHVSQAVPFAFRVIARSAGAASRSEARLPTRRSAHRPCPSPAGRRRPRRELATAALVALVLSSFFPLLAQPSNPGWSDLVAIDRELGQLQAWPRSEGSDPAAALTAESIAARADAAAALRTRLEALDPQGWSVAGKVDYLVVWAQLNGVDFEHRVTRPWQQDPIVYHSLVQRVPYTELPAEGEAAERFAARLRAVPAIVERAKANLTEPLGELADLALFHLENFDGVGQGQPYRDDPPGGTLAWYDDLCARVSQRAPSENGACDAARDAVVSFRDWLRSERPSMKASAGIGAENLEWYVRNVRLLPFSAAEMTLLGKREYHRYHAAYQIARNRNGSLPELELTKSREQHEQRTREAERQIRALVEAQQLMTFPEETPEEFDTDTFWSPRAATDRHFWEELQFRNALNNHIHASVPGHRFDGVVARGVENPIRRRSRDSSRAEGWATYLEEMFLLAGLTRDVPRADELFYVALMKRASRIYAEFGMHGGTLSLDEANETMIDTVPFMEEDLGRYDLEGYLRRPGSGSGYIIGKIQLEQLLSERALQLGEDFELGAFHDEVLRAGWIPFTLLRWELLGTSDEVAPLWKAATGQELTE